MKKIIFTTFFILYASQLVFSQVRIGVRASGLISNLHNRSTSEELLNNTTKVKAGYQLGVMFEHRFNLVIFFQSGLLLSRKGSKLEERRNEVGGVSTISIDQNPLYLELPLALGITFNFLKTRVFATGGSYIAYGIGGKYSYSEVNGNTLNGLIDQDIRWGNSSEVDDPKDLRRFDMGLMFSGGLQFFDRLQLALFYNPGVVNISPDNTDRRLFNSTYGLSATLFLIN